MNHMQIAIRELGVQEIVGKSHNSRILEYFKSTSYQATTDETPWCAAFVGWVLQQSGVANTKSAAALSYKDWGVPVAFNKLRYGDVAVFDYGNGRGHVGFVTDVVGNNVMLLGGNQGNKVSIAPYSIEKLAAVRRKKGVLDSTTVVAAASSVVAAGTVVTNRVADVTVVPISDAAVNGGDEVLVALEQFSKTIATMLSPEYADVVGSLVSMLASAYVIIERIRKLRKVQV